MEKERKYNLTVTETQLKLIAACVEDCHRLLSGQPEMFNTVSCIDNYCNFKDAMEEVAQIINPDLPRNAAYGWTGSCCPNEHQRKFIARTYPIYREILHRLRVLNRKPDDNYYNVYDSETLTCVEGGELPIIEPVEQQ